MSHDQSSPPAAERKIPVKEIEIRRFVRDDLKALPELLRQCMGRHESESWLDWKFFQSPYDDDLAFVVAVHEGDLVGFIGANPVPFSVDGERSPVYQHQDTAIREDCRSLRLLRQMIEVCAEIAYAQHVKLTYSITVPHMRALVTKRMKYTIVWENLKMVKLISLKGYVSKATRSAALTALIPGPIARSWKTPGSMTGDLAELDSFGPGFDEFWAEANCPGDNLGRIFGWQDSTWLNYKFCGDEVVDFKKFAYSEAGKILGYLVLNITRLDVRVGYIEALWAVPGRDDVIKLLVDFAINQLLRLKTDQVVAWTRPEVPLGRALADRGFVRRPTAQCISAKHVHPQPDDIGLKGEHWNLQRGHTYYTSLGHLAIDEGSQRLYKAKAARDQARSEKLRAEAASS